MTELYLIDGPYGGQKIRVDDNIMRAGYLLMAEVLNPPPLSANPQRVTDIKVLDHEYRIDDHGRSAIWVKP